MTSRVLFAEVPGFYAEVERQADPALAGRAVIVGGDPRKGGLVQAATSDAREAGVTEKMLMMEALERCPHARALRTDLRRYRETALRLRACLRRVLDRLEPAGLGAAFLEASGSPDSSEELARRLREDVRVALGLPLRVGVAPVKFVAKLAAEEADRHGVRVVRPREVMGFLHPLPTSRLPGVGPNTAARLAELGAHRVGDVATLPEQAVEEALGKHGLAILDAARGHGDSRIQAARHPQSVSQELTLEAEELDRRVLTQRLEEIAEHLERALHLEELAARRVTLKVRYGDQETATRTRTLTRPVASAPEFLQIGLELLGRTQAGVRPVRLLGLAAGTLLQARRDDRQLELFPAEP
jgi:DNA polymerase-4